MNLAFQTNGTAASDARTQEPAQRQRNFLINVIGARHEGMRRIQKLVVAQINPGGETEQQNCGDYADETGTCGARQHQLLAKIKRACSPHSSRPIEAEVFDQLPSPRRGPEHYCAENGQYKYKSEQV